MNIRRIFFWLLISLVILGSGYLWQTQQTSYFIIEEENPADATIVAFARLADSNPECKQLTVLSGTHYLP